MPRSGQTVSPESGPSRSGFPEQCREHRAPFNSGNRPLSGISAPRGIRTAGHARFELAAQVLVLRAHSGAADDCHFCGLYLANKFRKPSPLENQVK
jgi:hypothetical protein